jgi:hypothetical protein
MGNGRQQSDSRAEPIAVSHPSAANILTASASPTASLGCLSIVRFAASEAGNLTKVAVRT